MNKIVAVFMVSAALTTVLTGCGNKAPVPTQSAALPSDSVPSADAREKRTEFESDFGYTISYEEAAFDYRRTEGYDEFVLKSDAVDKPFVFISISNVGAEFAEQAKEAALGDAPELCTIGQAQIEGQCSETEEAWDGGKVIRKTYVCPLASGAILLIETQRYTEQAEDPYAARLREMIDSIQIAA